jgi:hypothetical protein
MNTPDTRGQFDAVDATVDPDAQPTPGFVDGAWMGQVLDLARLFTNTVDRERNE